MKIIPQNGMILIKYLGRGETTSASGIITPEKMEVPPALSIVNCRVDAFEADWKDEREHKINLVVGQVVMTTFMSIKPISDSPGFKECGFIRWADVIAVIEEENENVN